MTAGSIFKEQGTYFGDQTIGGIPCTIGYIKKFKWSWMATQLNTFIIVGKSPEKIDMPRMLKFSADCFAFALKNNKGWPRGLQAAVASIAILEGNDVAPDAKRFCEGTANKHWSAFEIPVVFDTSENKAYRFLSAPIWGRIYYPYLGETADSVTSRLVG